MCIMAQLHQAIPYISKSLVTLMVGLLLFHLRKNEVELCNVQHAAIPEMEQKNQDETLSYSGQSVTVENLRGEFCPACGEGVWDSESNQRLDEAQTALMNTARSEVSANIRRIRKSLKLTQAELAKNRWPRTVGLLSL